MQKKESLLSQRGQMCFWAIGLWIFLAAWSLSAFWQHIDSLNPTYQWAAKCGAAGGEFALLGFIILHCFNKHIGVRKWSLILGFILAAVVVAHTGALRGLDEAEVKQADTEKRLEETLTRMSKEQGAKIAENSVVVGAARSQRERLALANKSNAEQGRVAGQAQELLAKEITSRTEKVKDASIFPRWYVNGWMYSLIFIVSLGFMAFVFSRMMNKEDIDADFDGIPDRQQGSVAGIRQPVGYAPALTAQDNNRPKS